MQPLRRSDPVVTTTSASALPLTRKAAWGAGGFVENLTASGVSVMALPIFNVALGINPIWLGWALAIPRALDAATDPLLGNLSDNTRTRWGRRRPWVCVGAVLCAFFFGLIWSVPTGWSAQAQFWFFAIVCTMLFLCTGLFGISYNALGLELTEDYNERTKVQAWRFFFIACSGLMVGWLYKLSLLPVFTGAPVEGVRPEVIGMRHVGWAAAALILLAGLTPAIFCREAAATQVQPKIKILPALRMTFTNRAFVMFMLLFTVTLIGAVLVGSFGFYIVLYHVCQGDKALTGTLLGWQTVANTTLSFAMIPIVTWAAGRFGKRTTVMMAQILLGVGSLSTLILYTPQNPWLTVAAIFFTCPALTTLLILNGSMLAEVCDVDELKYGLRREGMFGAATAFVSKVVFSSLTIISGYLLAFSGYQDGPTQSPETLTRMRLLFALVPVICAAAGLGITLLFPITKATAARVRAELDERHASDASHEVGLTSAVEPSPLA